MKKNNLTLLNRAVNNYFQILTSTPSKNDALKSIADRVIADFGDFITPGNLNITDEVFINLIELIDQIIYEFKENDDYNSNIRDYIIDDLYSKLSLTLEALTDQNIYSANLRNRSLYPDDLIIIKNKNISAMVPVLISESEGITNLEKEIIKTLLYFKDESLVEFFYNSFKNSTSGFIKSAALLGLKYNSGRGLNWDSISEISNGQSDLIQFAEKFDLCRIDANPCPSSKEEMTFTILHIEKNISAMNDTDSINWILSLLISIPSFSFENSWLYEINTSICNILLNIDLCILKEILKNETVLIKTIKFIDLLPGNIFNRLTGRFDSLGMEFLFNLNSAIEKKKIIISSSNSNIMNYLCWNATETF
jgi:hypothetical protein